MVAEPTGAGDSDWPGRLGADLATPPGRGYTRASHTDEREALHCVIGRDLTLTFLWLWSPRCGCREALG